MPGQDETPIRVVEKGDSTDILIDIPEV